MEAKKPTSLEQKIIDAYEEFIPKVYEACRFVEIGSGEKHKGVFDVLVPLINQHEKEMWGKIETEMNKSVKSDNKQITQKELKELRGEPIELTTTVAMVKSGDDILDKRHEILDKKLTEAGAYYPANRMRFLNEAMQVFAEYYFDKMLNGLEKHNSKEDAKIFKLYCDNEEMIMDQGQFLNALEYRDALQKAIARHNNKD